MFEARALREYFVLSSLLMMELDAALAARDTEWIRTTARELADASRTVGAMWLTKAAMALANAPERWDVVQTLAVKVDEQMLAAEMTLRLIAEVQEAA